VDAAAALDTAIADIALAAVAITMMRCGPAEPSDDLKLDRNLDHRADVVCKTPTPAG
jgi:hypothetical protein